MKQGWERKKLGEVCTLVTDGDWIESKHQSGEGIRLIQTGNVGVGVFKAKEDRPHYISKETFDELGCTEIFPGDCLVSRLPDPVGRACIVPNLGFRMITAVDCSILRFKNIVLPDFFVYYTQCAVYQRDVNNNTTGTTRKRISRKNLESLPIPVPPLPIQERIVEELDCISGIIEKKKEQLKELDALAQSIFYTMFGDPVENDKGWEVKKLGEVCDVTSFKRVLIEEVVDSGIPFIRGTELSALSKLPNSKEYNFSLFITPEHYERVKAISGVPSIGDLLIPSINSEGLIWELDTNEPRYFKDGRVLWVHTNKQYSNSKALKYIIGNKLRLMYNELASGATFIELKLFILREMLLPFPPLPLQQEFAKKIEAIEKQKELIRKSIREVETLLASRMQEYFE